MSADAKPMTTKDVEDMPKHTDNPHTYVAEYPNHVLVRRAELLATTLALEKLEAGLALWHGLPPDERAMKAIHEAGNLANAARYRAEKAEAERDNARELGTELMTGLMAAQARAEEAEKERDAAVARRDEVIADLDRIQGQVGPELARLRALVAELVAVLARLERLASKVGFEDTCDAARDVLRKAKEACL